jgi:hypothetical protein
MDKVSYKLTVGDWSVDSAEDARTELIELDIRLGLDAAGDVGRVIVYAPPAPAPSLLEQVVGAASDALGFGGGGEKEAAAFGIDIRGKHVALGDSMRIELRVGDSSALVFSADIQLFRSGLGVTMVCGRSGAQKLAMSRLNQSYEQQSLRQIISDLAGQAGVQIGTVAEGATYSYVVVHESKNLLQTIRELAAREGKDFYFDSENKLMIQPFEKSKADHTFYYGIDLLEVEMVNLQPSSEHILIYGESPASNQGADSWHWLVKDNDRFRSEIGEGGRTLALQDGMIRTKDAADAAAKAKFGAIKDGSALGRLKLLARPTLRLGDAIELKNVPKPELNGLFKVTAVRHLFSKQQGLVTFANFSGQGRAAAAGDLLGQLGGALAGAIGI